MKTVKYYFYVVAMCSFIFTSCSKDEPISDTTSNETAELSFGSVLNAMVNKAANAKQAGDLPDCSSAEAAYALIELTYGAANTPVNVSVPVMFDGEIYFTAYSEDLEIPVPTGSDWVTINLTSFEVYSEDDVKIWKAPYTGSEFDQFVENALPMEFELRAGSKNYVDVEVLCFDERVVNKYGYQFFDIIPEELRTLCFFVNYCTDAGRHYTANYDLDLFYYTGEPTDGTPASEDLEVLYLNQSPIASETAGGVFYADPLCLAIPERQMGEANDEPYLYYQVTLVEWSENYTMPEDAVVQTGFLSWNDIVALLDTDEDGSIEDNTDANYWHVQLNCGTDDGPLPVEGDDMDNDDIPDDIDQCDDTPAGVDVYETGDRIGCTIDDEACNAVTACELTVPDLGGFCNVTSLEDSVDGWIKVEDAEELFLTYTEAIGGTSVRVATVDVSVTTENDLVVVLDTPEDESEIINATDHITAYAIEVRPNVGGERSNECWESRCANLIEEYGSISRTFDGLTYAYPVHVRVSTVSCYEPVE